MTEYNYPECTTSVLSALEMFTKRYPEYRADEIRSVSPPPSPSLSPSLPFEVDERMLKPAFLFFGRVGAEKRFEVRSSISMLRSGKTEVGTGRGASVSLVRSLLLSSSAPSFPHIWTRQLSQRRFVYGSDATNFALESLAYAGETHTNSDSVRRACAFLLEKQMEDGGWGETYMVRFFLCILSRESGSGFDRSRD